MLNSNFPKLVPYIRGTIQWDSPELWGHNRIQIWQYIPIFPIYTLKALGCLTVSYRVWYQLRKLEFSIATRSTKSKKDGSRTDVIECTLQIICKIHTFTLSLDLPRSLRRGDAWCMHHASNQFDRGGSGIKRWHLDTTFPESSRPAFVLWDEITNNNAITRPAFGWMS